MTKVAEVCHLLSVALPLQGANQEAQNHPRPPAGCGFAVTGVVQYLLKPLPGPAFSEQIVWCMPRDTHLAPQFPTFNPSRGPWSARGLMSPKCGGPTR